MEEGKLYRTVLYVLIDFGVFGLVERDLIYYQNIHSIGHSWMHELGKILSWIQNVHYVFPQHLLSFSTLQSQSQPRENP